MGGDKVSELINLKISQSKIKQYQLLSALSNVVELDYMRIKSWQFSSGLAVGDPRKS